MNRRRWIWVILFILVALLLGTLAAGWNVVLVSDYWRMLELARQFAAPKPARAPWPTLIFGTLGFVVALGTMIVFFVRLLREMRLTQLQSDFLATVSHELKTPIAAMELNSSLLRAGGLSEDEVSRLWQSHQSELHRLREEVERLLEAARWSSNTKIHARDTHIDLESWLNQSLSRWRQILGPDSELRREGDPLKTEIATDLRTLNLIADNIVDNARKYSRGAPRVLIHTRLVSSPRRKKRARWQIAITDRGWGFEPSEAKKLFGRFYRGKNGKTKSVPGTGLGLYLAETASRALGISITADSLGTGRGAVFTLQGKARTR